MATQKKKAPAKKKEAPAEVAPAQEEKPEERKGSEEKVIRESKTERVITILSAEDIHFLSQFEISRSALTRAVLRGTREFLEREEFKTASEMEIVERLRFLLK